jgi:hypothetical protein
MLTTEMQKLINDYNIGLVSTINDDSTPAVSPKGTFIVVDDNNIAFGNIRSPQTLHNISVRKEVEVCFVDVLLRKVLRVAGSANVSPKSQTDVSIVEAFREIYPAYIDLILEIVFINIKHARIIYSPAYDIGLSKEDLYKISLKKLNELKI